MTTEADPGTCDGLCQSKGLTCTPSVTTYYNWGAGEANYSSMSCARVFTIDECTDTVPYYVPGDCGQGNWAEFYRRSSTCFCGESACTPNCSGRECGTDGCGGSCGTCTGVEECGANGICAPAGIPPAWTCSDSYYHASDGCDCECGAYDPDCGVSGQQLYNCGAGATGCSSQGHCTY